MGDIHRQIEMFGSTEVQKLASSARERRRVQWASEIMAAEDEAINYLHSGFCQASLPHRRPKNDLEPWVRRNGIYQLVIRPGILPTDDGVVNVGVPYGCKARLILIYLHSEARRTQNPCVDLGPSMRSWLRRLGLSSSGGERGAYIPIREQILRIARCEFTLRWPTEGNSSQIADQRLVDGLKLWRDDDDVDQVGLIKTRGEWMRYVNLAQPFFEHLMEHAVPLDEHAVVRLKNSSLGLDCYVWLVHRLRRLSKETIVPWHALSDHFGSESEHRLLAFRMKETLRDVLAVYPEAKVEWSRRGLILRPSRPAVASTRVQVPAVRLVRS